MPRASPTDGYAVLPGGSFLTNAPSLYVKPPFDPATNTPERFTVYIKSEIPEFEKIVKTAGITPA